MTRTVFKISQTGTTQLGLREGHDVKDSAFVSSSTTATQYNYLIFRTSEYTGTTYDPVLSVTYTTTSTTTTTIPATTTTTTSTTNALTYTYDAFDDRVSKATTTATTYYPSKSYNTDGTTNEVYLSGPSGTLASLNNTATTSTLSTFATDHLGSTAVLSDSSGYMTSLMDYHGYGNSRLTAGSTTEKKTFIGEYADSETGLSYLNARYYDPARGQFLSQDSVYLSIGSGQDKREQVALLDPQSQNSYSYGRGNPLSLKDPSGEFIPLVIGAAWLAFEVGSTAYDAYTTYDAWSDPNGSSWDRWSAIGGLALGAVLPGGGYGSLANKADDVVDGVRGATTQIHHIFTDKNTVSNLKGGPWTQRFQRYFDGAGYSMNDPINKIEIPGHFGPHPQAYHQYLFKTIDGALRGLIAGTKEYSQVFEKTVETIRQEFSDSTSALSKFISK